MLRDEHDKQHHRKGVRTHCKWEKLVKPSYISQMKGKWLPTDWFCHASETDQGARKLERNKSRCVISELPTPPGCPYENAKEWGQPACSFCNCLVRAVQNTHLFLMRKAGIPPVTPSLGHFGTTIRLDQQTQEKVYLDSQAQKYPD